MTTRFAELASFLDRDWISHTLADRVAASSDRSGLEGALPLAVAHPRNVGDVQEVVRAASARGVPLVPRGAGTGLAGGANATEGSVVVDLSALDRIVSISTVTRLAVVEPGVITAHLDRAAAANGLRYAPDPASAEISTIGGNIATNAGGLRCVKYGVTRSAVRSLEVVLADGSLLRTGATTVKSTAGYDLTSLFVGSEGTLGIIVGATLALQPLPTRTATLAATFDSVSAAASAVAAVLASGAQPSVMELMDGATLLAVARHLGIPQLAAGALLIVQTDGVAAEAEIEQARASISGAAATLEVTLDQDRAAELLRARRSALPAIEAIGRPFIEDIAVPLDRLAEAIDAMGHIARRHGVRIFTFAHAGDGNLHPIIVSEQRDDGVDESVARAADAVFELALELGGTVAGEHGIGLLKREWLAREADPVSVAVQRSLKDALDPHHLLNPGKALPPRTSTAHQRNLT